MNKRIAVGSGVLILLALVLGVASVYRGTPVEKSIAGKGANARSVAARPAPTAPSPDQTGPVAYLQPCPQPPCTGPLFRVIEMPKPCQNPCFVLERVESGDPADCLPGCFVIAETAQDCLPECAYVIRLTEPGLSFDDVDGWLPCQRPCRYVIEPVAAGSGQ